MFREGEFYLGCKFGLVSGIWYLFENRNSKKFSQCFFVKTQFLQTKLGKCGFVHALEFFLDFWLKVVFRVQVPVLIE